MDSGKGEHNDGKKSIKIRNVGGGDWKARKRKNCRVVMCARGVKWASYVKRGVEGEGGTERDKTHPTVHQLCWMTISGCQLKDGGIRTI